MTETHVDVSTDCEGSSPAGTMRRRLLVRHEKLMQPKEGTAVVDALGGNG